MILTIRIEYGLLASYISDLHVMSPFHEAFPKGAKIGDIGTWGSGKADCGCRALANRRPGQAPATAVYHSSQTPAENH